MFANRSSDPQVFLSRDSPRYFHRLFQTDGMLRPPCDCHHCPPVAHLKRANARKGRTAAAGVPQAHIDKLLHAFEHSTDRENPSFRICTNMEGLPVTTLADMAILNDLYGAAIASEGGVMSIVAFVMNMVEKDSAAKGDLKMS